MNVHPSLDPLFFEGLELTSAFNQVTGQPHYCSPVFQRTRNDLLGELIARRPLPGEQPENSATGQHKWKVGYSRVTAAPGRDYGINPLTGLPYFSDSVFQKTNTPSRHWRIFVGSGCVNDEPACIQYLRENDPRGWKMPPSYGPWKKLQAVFGDEYPFVDRPLYEAPDQPHVILTAPDADGADLGGFELVPPTARPLYFRTERMWKFDLYRAHVVVSVAPYRADPFQTSLNVGGAVPKRWRIHAGRFPSKVSGAGVSATSFHELARIYLVRRPGDVSADRLHVQQRCYWSLQCRSALNQSLLELAAAVVETAALGTLGVIGLGPFGLALGTGLLALEVAMTNLLLDQLQGIVADTSSVEFWSV